MILRSVTLVALCGLVVASSALATSEIRRHVFAGGAIGGAGATHVVRSTLGQTIVGEAISASHSIHAGFWIPGHGTVGVEESVAVPPGAFNVYQNTPNPFNPATRIAYDVPAGGGRVRLAIYSISGRLVKQLIGGSETPGFKHVEWDGRDERGQRVSSGIYLYTFSAPGLEITKKMVLLQ